MEVKEMKTKSNITKDFAINLINVSIDVLMLVMLTMQFITIKQEFTPIHMFAATGYMCFVWVYCKDLYGYTRNVIDDALDYHTLFHANDEK